MAISNTALTMSQYALSTNEPRVVAVVNDLLNNGSIMARDIPFVDHKSLFVKGSRFTGQLPAVNWAKLNDPAKGGVAVPETFTEQAYMIRNKVETDHVMLEDVNQFHNPHAFSVGAYLQSIAYDFNNKFFNNHHRKDGELDSLVGLRERINNGSKYGVNSGAKINANGADLTFAGTNTEYAKVCELLDKTLIFLGSPGGDGVNLYMNTDLFTRLSAKTRIYSGAGGFSVSSDQWGRSVTKYKNASIYDVGYKADQETKIITSTEEATGEDGSGTFTSIYAVKYGGNGLSGWQYGPISVKDIPDPEGVLKKTFIEWVGGIAASSTRSFARIYNIKIS